MAYAEIYVEKIVFELYLVRQLQLIVNNVIKIVGLYVCSICLISVLSFHFFFLAC